MEEKYNALGEKAVVEYMRETVSPEKTNRIRSHPNFELMLIVRGEISYVDKVGVERLKDRSLVFIRPHEIHNPVVSSDAVYERYKISFDGDVIFSVLKSRELAERLISLSYKKQLSDLDYSAIFLLMKSAFEEAKAGACEGERMALFILSALLLGAEAVRIEDEPARSYLTDVIECVKKEYGTPITCERLAARFFVSRGKLLSDFKHYCKTSLTEFISVTRIEAAKEMLLKGHSVGEVSEKCGFSSPSYFIKKFTALVGLTPLKFRIKYSIEKNGRSY